MNQILKNIFPRLKTFQSNARISQPIEHRAKQGKEVPKHKTNNSSRRGDLGSDYLVHIMPKIRSSRIYLFYWLLRGRRRIVNRLMIVQLFNAHIARFNSFCTIFCPLLLLFQDNSADISLWFNCFSASPSPLWTKKINHFGDFPLYAIFSYYTKWITLTL